MTGSEAERFSWCDFRAKTLILLGQIRHTCLLFFFFYLGRGTGPKRSGAVLACFWANFQAEPSILIPIRVIFDDLGPN